GGAGAERTPEPRRDLLRERGPEARGEREGRTGPHPQERRVMSLEGRRMAVFLPLLLGQRRPPAPIRAGWQVARLTVVAVVASPRWVRERSSDRRSSWRSCHTCQSCHLPPATPASAPPPFPLPRTPRAPPAAVNAEAPSSLAAGSASEPPCPALTLE